MKKELPEDWKARVLFLINEKTCFTDADGKRCLSPLYEWVEKLFSNHKKDEKWAQLADRLSVNVVTDALAVCRQALFSFPAPKFPWDSPAARSASDHLPVSADIAALPLVTDRMPALEAPP